MYKSNNEAVLKGKDEVIVEKIINKKAPSEIRRGF
jgi:hypothetical protein